MFNKLNPLIADGGAEKDVSLKEDFKKSVRVEKFRIGEKAVYVPAGFSWKVAPWAQEAPAIRLRHRSGEEILELEKEKSAQKALELLGHGA